jgi:hypothetical protein
MFYLQLEWLFGPEGAWRLIKGMLTTFRTKSVQLRYSQQTARLRVQKISESIESSVDEDDIDIAMDDPA